MAGCVWPENVEVMGILEYCVKHEYLMQAALFAVGCGTGGRASELVCIRRGDVLDNGGIRDVWRLTKLKARKTAFREIPWNHVLDTYLLPWLEYQQEVCGLESADDYVFGRHPDNHITREYAWLMMTRIYIKIRISKKIALHGMRKFFGRGIYDYELKRTGDQLVALETARQALGHERLDTTIRYLNLRQENIRTALTGVFAFMGAGKTDLTDGTGKTDEKSSIQNGIT